MRLPVALASCVAPRLSIEKPSVRVIAINWPKLQSLLWLEPLFESQKGGRLTTSAMGQLMADLVKAARNLVPEETSVHTLRHTFALHYLAPSPGDIVGLATLLGHSSLYTTRLYSQPSVEQLATRVEQLNINAYSQ